MGVAASQLKVTLECKLAGNELWGYLREEHSSKKEEPLHRPQEELAWRVQGMARRAEAGTVQMEKGEDEMSSQ